MTGVHLRVDNLPVSTEVWSKNMLYSQQLGRYGHKLLTSHYET